MQTGSGVENRGKGWSDARRPAKAEQNTERRSRPDSPIGNSMETKLTLQPWQHAHKSQTKNDDDDAQNARDGLLIANKRFTERTKQQPIRHEYQTETKYEQQ